jgi:putative ABC transport system permease protein
VKLPEILRTAVGNAFRSKVRTTLTILAIFVGAFTLTLTNGVGTGVTNYIDSQVASFGSTDSMLVTQASLTENGGFGASTSGPVEFDPDRTVLTGGMGPGFEALSDSDLEAMRAMPGVASAEPLLMASPDYIRGPNGKMFDLTLNPSPTGPGVALTAGASIARDEPESQILIPVSFVEALGFGSDAAAVGASIWIGISDVFGTRHEVEAQVNGVQEESLLAFGMIASQGLVKELYAAQTTGLPAALAGIYPAATLRMTPTADANRVKAELLDAGLSGQTVADRMGSIHSVVNGIVGVLNAFAVIALIAAGFGIVNTLLMSVQERTREIGLMKAMGMGGKSIFALFSAEAVFIGFLGSAIGSLIAIGLGSVISSVLAAGPLSDLAGLRVLEFAPFNVVVVIAVVMLLAFLSGTLPAARAARLDPIAALRYE